VIVDGIDITPDSEESNPSTATVNFSNDVTV
jgi:hypothetical protein